MKAAVGRGVLASPRVGVRGGNAKTLRDLGAAVRRGSGLPRGFLDGLDALVIPGVNPQPSPSDSENEKGLTEPLLEFVAFRKAELSEIARDDHVGGDTWCFSTISSGSGRNDLRAASWRPFETELVMF